MPLIQAHTKILDKLKGTKNNKAFILIIRNVCEKKIYREVIFFKRLQKSVKCIEYTGLGSGRATITWLMMARQSKQDETILCQGTSVNTYDGQIHLHDSLTVSQS